MSPAQAILLGMITHLSYSSLTTWERCGKQFELGRIVKAEPIPAVYFVAGTAVHKATENHDRGNPEQSWKDLFYSGVEEALVTEPNVHEWMSGGSELDPDDCDKWMELGPLCISNWKTFVSTEFDVDKRDIECDVTTYLPGLDIPVKGFIDRTGFHKKHGHMIIDIKAGRNTPKDKGMQLGIYSALYEHKFGIRINKGAYYMAREGRLSRPYDLSDYTIEKVAGIFRATALKIGAGRYPAKQEFTCRFCDQRLNCFKVSGDTPRTRYYDRSNPKHDDYQEEIPF